MKAIIEFNLDEVEDRQNHMCAVKSKDLALAWHSIREYLHRRLDHERLPEAQQKIVEEIQQHLFDIENQYNIVLDELIS